MAIEWTSKYDQSFRQHSEEGRIHGRNETEKTERLEAEENQGDTEKKKLDVGNIVREALACMKENRMDTEREIRVF